MSGGGQGWFLGYAGSAKLSSRCFTVSKLYARPQGLDLWGISDGSVDSGSRRGRLLRIPGT